MWVVLCVVFANVVWLFLLFFSFRCVQCTFKILLGPLERENWEAKVEFSEGFFLFFSTFDV